MTGEVPASGAAVLELALPVGLALPRAVRKVPGPGPWAYEPKFDGCRGAIIGPIGSLQSRSGKDLSARFPELTGRLRELGPVMLDGEIVALRDGELEPAALSTTPAARRRAGAVVLFVAFDLLALGDVDLRPLPYRTRRSALEQLLAAPVGRVQLVPMTTDRDRALKWMQPDDTPKGIEGVVAKPLGAPYRARRGDWLKVRQKVTVDALVVGVTGSPDRPHALVLARADDTGHRRVFELSSSLSRPVRDALAGRLHADGGPRSLVKLLGGRPPAGVAAAYVPVRLTVTARVETEPLMPSREVRHRPRLLWVHPPARGDSRATDW